MKTILPLSLLALTVFAVSAADNAATAPAAVAKSKPASTSIEIFCDGPVKYTMTNATVVYTNNVRATDSESTLTCDVLTMQLTESANAAALLDSSAPSTPKTTNGPVRWIVAEGNVVLTNEKGRALAGKAVYDVTSDVITLTGTARVVPVSRLLTAITNKLSSLQLQYDTQQGELGRKDTEAVWRFTGLRRVTKPGTPAGESLQGTVRAVLSESGEWSVKGDGDLTQVQITLPGRPILESPSGWSVSSKITFDHRTGNIEWQPPFEFKGSAPSSVLSLPGTGSAK